MKLFVLTTALLAVPLGARAQAFDPIGDLVRMLAPPPTATTARAVRGRRRSRIGTGPLPVGRGTLMHATWYGAEVLRHGRGRNADGSAFHPEAMSVAHRWLPFGTVVTVQNPRTGRAVRAVVHDRGPFRRGYDIDLSHGLARAIGMGGSGTVAVSY